MRQALYLTNQKTFNNKKRQPFRLPYGWNTHFCLWIFIILICFLSLQLLWLSVIFAFKLKRWNKFHLSTTILYYHFITSIFKIYWLFCAISFKKFLTFQNVSFISGRVSNSTKVWDLIINEFYRLILPEIPFWEC